LATGSDSLRQLLGGTMSRAVQPGRYEDTTGAQVVRPMDSPYFRPQDQGSGAGTLGNGAGVGFLAAYLEANNLQIMERPNADRTVTRWVQDASGNAVVQPQTMSTNDDDFYNFALLVGGGVTAANIAAAGAAGGAGAAGSSAGGGTAAPAASSGGISGATYGSLPADAGLSLVAPGATGGGAALVAPAGAASIGTAAPTVAGLSGLANTTLGSSGFPALSGMDNVVGAGASGFGNPSIYSPGGISSLPGEAAMPEVPAAEPGLPTGGADPVTVPDVSSGGGGGILNSFGNWASRNPMQAVQLLGLLGSGRGGGSSGGDPGGGAGVPGAQAGITAQQPQAFQRQYVAPPAGHRPGFDPEHKYFTGIGAVGTGD
jgi:hypothetical protein